MSEENRISTPSEVYNEWVKGNPGVDPMHPFDEQDANYMNWLVKADPSITGKGWAGVLSCVGANRGSSRPTRTHTELRQLEISRLWETACSIRS